MDLVLERKSKQSKERRSSNTRSRDDRRAHESDISTPSTDMTPQSTPQTPHHFRHYSDRVLGDAFASRAVLPPFDASDPRTPRPRSKARGSSRAATPAGRTIYSRGLTPHRPSSPGSSPTRIVNMVSSPGPMRSSPVRPAKETKLPYVLPPGPYSEDKPDCAYAGLIGQAILSSPEHRLTLQDIYEWITTVHPYYKRGEQTWMNSVRHCLSTMAVFRKVPRVRNEGKSLWAIFDDDVAAFASGSFKKSLCADMVKQEKEKQAKRGPRKRGAAMDDGRDSKRHKSVHVDAEGSRPAAPHPMLPPYFPPFHVNPNQQPYYQAYAPQAIPAEVVFPPLPPNAGFARSVSRPMSVRPTSSAGSIAPRPVSAAGSAATDASIVRGRDRSPKPISSSSSVPALTPNCSSSSSPPLSSHASMMDDARYSSSPALSPMRVAIMDTDDEEDELDTGWLRRGPPIQALAPSATLLRPAEFNTPRRSKSKQRDARNRYKVCRSFGGWNVVAHAWFVSGSVGSARTRITHPRAQRLEKQAERGASPELEHASPREHAAVALAVYAPEQALHTSAQAARHQRRRPTLPHSDTDIPCRLAHEPLTESCPLQIQPRPAPALNALPTSPVARRSRELADDATPPDW
ncbi:uncharacterized protein B0H18DRAFT_73862 [Fomitopsis serialis]|uniref:uncharacterized protein n=1 Tax=Fomitopsis serialis TaxID=139415 RepID=UPI0020080E86|nr:uncharacterized protein B0H18DRAFT_73862 [Neoantrodia serialis]KAH9916323.1 hypothetical protein B0H18DRAFT_73862 [Neoantrodia serialis]